MYGIGLAIVALGGVFVPLLTEPGEEDPTEKLKTELAAAQSARDTAQRERDEEREARKAAEQERDEAVAARDEAKSALETSETEREEAVAAQENAGEERDTERQTRMEAEAAKGDAEKVASDEAVARAAIAAEIEHIEESQSQFELYEDKGGKYRWRLRHRNGNVIATSGEGYVSRQKAQQGLAGVKRDAYGAAAIDIERTDKTVDAVDDAVEGEDAPSTHQRSRARRPSNSSRTTPASIADGFATATDIFWPTAAKATLLGAG